MIPPCGERAGLRVLALLSDGAGAAGGIARYNQALLGALARDGRVAHISAIVRNGDGPIADNVQIVRCRSRLAFALSAMQRAAVGRFHLVLCGHLHYATIARLAARLCGAPVWCVTHGIEAWASPGALTRRAVNSAHRVIAVSRYTRRAITTWSHLEPHRLRVLPPTFDSVFAERDRAPRAHTRRPRLLSVSRLDARERYKGQDTVIRCLGALTQRYPQLHYQIVGDGDDRARLEQLANDCGVASHVEFLGAANLERLRQIYRDVDAFVMPSRGEGFGIVFLEALASGLPVVAGNADGSSDALRDGLLGILVDPDDPDDVARGVEAALDRAPTTVSALTCFAPPAFDARVTRLLDELEVAA